MEMEEATIKSCVKGYHIYRTLWNCSPAGQEFECERESSNGSDRYTVVVTRNAETIGHIPRNISKVCSIFLRTGGSIQ